MKKILYITTVSRTINAFLVPHIEMLLENGYKVDCATCVDKKVNQVLINKGVKIFNIPFSRSPLSFGNIKAFRELIKLQKENKYDIVHVHTPVASVYGRLLKIKFPKLKTIYTAHGFHFYKGAPKKSWAIFYTIEKLMSNFTDTLITINKEDYDVALNKFNIKKLYFVNGVGVDIEKYKCSEEIDLKMREKLGLRKEDVVITVVAELSHRKNQKQLLYAINDLVKVYKNLKIILVGEGELKEKLNSYISENNLKDNVKMLGFRKDVNKILGATDIVGLFSYHEGLPRNLMEAMVAKKPIICTNIRGNNDLVQNNINGILVDVDSIEQTKKAIEKLYNDENIRKDMGKKSFEIVKSKYSLENVLNQMSNIFNFDEEVK
ncbi:glycosyltransferase family 4 protein [Clostridium perfringens]|uniref:glycosyltransferase family 4 protein n=1 Tax=Clostridium perfringens TaxID=1502 RepID=UPI002908B355|nr:glycosyltransferase family 4 protein [Clostridium perfringens]MDK0754900.1 glycosyltransferase family 4 protein [Clostridium perfringens]MDK0756650.1 glycosyltransferase family 4 protein [Clostridium perfringens]MDU7107627.1 glycosyltransferase family 4 protein [Clostridium perfringens]MDZ5063717.1 glycosyltransferase [Clostridium perfringens]